MQEVLVDDELWCRVLRDEGTSELYFEVLTGGIALYPARVRLTEEEMQLLLNDKTARKEFIWRVNNRPADFEGRMTPAREE